MLEGGYSVLHAVLGGVLIGLGSGVAAAATGRIPGVSGVVARLLRPRPGDAAWRVVFLVGLLGGAGLALAVVPSATLYRPVVSPAWAIGAGLLVGFGTRLGGGCTSGHGVCGLGLGSRSALIATVLFMAAAILTVLVVRLLNLSS